MPEIKPFKKGQGGYTAGVDTWRPERELERNLHLAQVPQRTTDFYSGRFESIPGSARLNPGGKLK